MQIFQIPFQAMASPCAIHLAAESLVQAQAAAAQAIAEVQRIERKYSRYREDSLLANLHRCAGRVALAIDSETSDLLDYADLLFQASDGLFDISSGILGRAWNFKQATRPEPKYLAQLLACVGWQRIERTKTEIYLPQAGMEIDFGGFGKEYAADRAATVLAELGVQSALIDLAGDLRILGGRPDGLAWQIGIQHPRPQKEPNELMASIPVFSGALTTSGDYERFIEIEGQRYCHILNPKTGYPVSYWRSVSVLAPVALAAGSYATIAMLKEAQGQTFLEESGLAYLAMDHTGSIYRRECQS